MQACRLSLALLAAGLVAGTLPAADEPAPKTGMMEQLRLQLIEDAKKKSDAPAPPAKAAAPAGEADKSGKPAAPQGPVSPEAAKASKAPPEPPTQLPKFEVTSPKITALDVKLQQQEKEIAQEKAKTQPSELDKALNSSKVAKALSIFGGESAQARATLASERVSLMEIEKDLMKAIGFAHTKAEKEELEKQLAEIKAMRRDLEQAPK